MHNEKKGKCVMQVSNSNVYQNRNAVNFTSIKNLNLKGYLDVPTEAKKMLDILGENSNFRNFVEHYDVVVNFTRDSKFNTHKFEMVCVDPLKLNKNENTLLGKIRKWFTKSKNYSISYSAKLNEKNLLNDSMETYLNQNTKKIIEKFETKPGVGKDDMGAEYVTIEYNKNINDAMKKLEDKINRRKRFLDEQAKPKIKEESPKLKLNRQENGQILIDIKKDFLDKLGK